MSGARRLRLGAECFILFVAAPIFTAYLIFVGELSNAAMPQVFLALFVLAMVLLFLTRGFSWRSLVQGRFSPDWRLLAAFVVATSIITVSMTLWLAPGRLFWLPTHAPELWRTIIIFYPIVSVLPQSIIYRALFFSRYRPIFPSDTAAIIANAFMFGLAHLFYLNWVAFVLTSLGGAVFAWVHYKRESYWFANLLHAFGGWAVFTSGLGGAYFYHGAI